MAYPFNDSLKLDQVEYTNDNEFSSVRHISNARLAKADYMNSLLTYAYGMGAGYGSKDFPILVQLAGKGRKRAVTSVDGSFQVQMYGKQKQTDSVAKYIPNQKKAGQHGGFFNIYFKNRFFMRNEVIKIGGVQKRISAQVYGDPVNHGGIWLYKLKIFGNIGEGFCPDLYLRKGATWGRGVVKVGLERSRGTEHRKPPVPFTYTNQCSLIRRSYNVAGNVANKKLKMAFDVMKNGKKQEIWFWTDWELFVNEMDFNQAKNEDLIFSSYNRDKNGNILNVDSDTGEPVPSGMGAWDLIPNTLRYQHMTENKIKDFISLMIENNEMGGNTLTEDYVIVGGTGLLEEIDTALKRSSDGFLTLSDKFVRGSNPKGLQFGAYFTEYLHSSGKIIKFVYDPAFDRGADAKTAPRHPMNPRRSIMSYCGLALDFSLVTVDKKVNKAGKEGNIVMLYEEGREYQDWMVLGGSKLPNVNMEQFKSRATDIDASAMHMMCSQGLHINYPNTCGKIICTLS